MKLDTREQMTILDVYKDLGSIIQDNKLNKTFRKIAENQFLEASELLETAHKLNQIFEMEVE